MDQTLSEFFKKYFELWKQAKLHPENDVELNRRQVISLTYLLSFCICFGSAVIFFLNHLHEGAVFHLLAALTSLWGGVLSELGRLRAARLLFPVFCIFYIVLCTFLFYGSSSDFEWLLIIPAAFSVTAFQIQKGKAQIAICLSAYLAFAFIELFAPQKSDFLSNDGRLAVALISYLVSMVMVVLITGVVVRKLRRLNDYLRELAEIDDLTKVYNRRKVLAEAVNVFADAVITSQRCCFAILDLDHFKRINDLYGHEMGDRVLRDTAQMMKKHTRKGDWLGRYGGEEFVFVMPNTKLDEAVRLMEQIRLQISDMTFSVEEVDSLNVTTSVGVAEIHEATERYEQILAGADAALYKAKHNGRNRVEVESSQ